MVQDLTDSDTVLFYYIGHGKNDGRTNYPMLNILGNTNGIAFGELWTRIHNAKPRLFISVVEACNSFKRPSQTDTVALPSRSYLADVPGLDEAAFDLFGRADGTIVLASASPGEFAAALSDEGPLFTSEFVQALHDTMGQAAEAGNSASWDTVLRAVDHEFAVDGHSQHPIVYQADLENAANRQSAPNQSAAFQQGLADRTGWENWFDQHSGSFADGAAFWAGHRSDANPPTCFGSNGANLGDWTLGCQAAQRWLSPTDKRRLSEPDYRLGWNSY